MAAIPTGQDDLDANTRAIHIASPDDFRNVSPVTDGKQVLVPFGTTIVTREYLGTCLSGTITQASDKKTRPDGLGGVEAITHTNLRWEVQMTCTFRVMTPSTASSNPTAGVGPVKIGDPLTFQLPHQGQAFAAPSGTTHATVMADKLFTIETVNFKFSDGEYATYDITAVHNVGLHDVTGVISAEVNLTGDALQVQTDSVDA